MNRVTFDELPDWLSPAEVCAYLKLSRNTVYELIRTGEIASRKFGRMIRVHRSYLSAILTDREVK